MSTFAVVTGGGTAGHVLPALAVADALVAAGHDANEIHYVGCERGIETRLVPDTAFDHTFFDVIGLQRSLDRRNLAFVPKMWSATRTATRLFRDLAPQVVVTVGGYASMPSVFAARRLGIPIVVVSYDRRPGHASSLTARFAAASAVAFDDSPLPNATMTGAPVRRLILDVDREHGRAAGRAALGVPDDRFLISVMGGSQGSGVLNDAIDAYLDRHLDDRTLAIRHAAGERFLDRRRPALDGSDGVLYQPLGYETDMASVYAASDLLLGRGGASTIHEVSVTGIPAILVPWSGAAEDHQRLNVEWLSGDGAAVELVEGDLGQLGEIIDRLRSDKVECSALAAAARRKGEVHRQGALAGLIERVASDGLSER